MIRRPPRSTRTDTLFPYTTLLRSPCGSLAGLFCDGAKMGIRPPAYGPNPPSERAMAYSRIVGTGSYLPAQSLSNVQLESRIDTTDERSEEHTSELQSLMRISYAVFCLKKKTTKTY